MDREFPRYRTAIRNGQWLRRCPSVEALFCLKNAGVWNNEDRQSLTTQLADREARWTIAGQLVPPGYSIDQATLDELFDVTAIEALMSRDKDIDAQQEPWLRECLVRLMRVLQGQHPNFPHD